MVWGFCRWWNGRGKVRLRSWLCPSFYLWIDFLTAGRIAATCRLKHSGVSVFPRQLQPMTCCQQSQIAARCLLSVFRQFPSICSLEWCFSFLLHLQAPLWLLWPASLRSPATILSLPGFWFFPWKGYPPSIYFARLCNTSKAEERPWQQVILGNLCKSHKAA